MMTAYFTSKKLSLAAIIAVVAHVGLFASSVA
jgi:hypothetical protein